MLQNHLLPLRNSFGFQFKNVPLNALKPQGIWAFNLLIPTYERSSQQRYRDKTEGACHQP